MDVENGTCGTVRAVRGSTLTVQPDGLGRNVKQRAEVLVDVKKYEKVELSYAVTGFRSQGKTIDETHVLLGGVGTSRQMAYVVGSRERETVHFYADRFEAGFQLEELAHGNAGAAALESPLLRDMKKSVEKRLAHDLMKVEVSIVEAKGLEHTRTREY
jgi:ATP-dependent exoDNAse (exonuclease V) alpha subunit